MYWHVVAVSMMLVVISVTMDWLTSTITTEQQKQPLSRGWQGHRIFLWERQNGSWTLMSISKNRGSGYPVAITTSSFTNRCFCMLPQQGGVSVTTPSAGARGSHHQNKTWGQNPLLWGSLVPTLCIRTSRTCIGMCTNSRDHLEEANAKRLWRSDSI